MKLRNILIVVKDIEKSKKFYPDIKYVNRLMTHFWGHGPVSRFSTN